MAVALTLAEKEREVITQRHRRQTERLRCKLAEIDGVRFCGDPDRRLPGLLHFLLPKVRSEAALIALDREGFECAAGAACSRGAQGPSHVLLAMGIAPEDAARALRVSLGRKTRDEELDRFAQAVSGIVAAAGARKE